MSNNTSYSIITTYRQYGDEISKPYMTSFKTALEVVLHLKRYDSNDKYSVITVYKNESSTNYIFNEQVKDLSKIFEDAVNEVNGIKGKWVSEKVESEPKSA